MSRNQTKEKKLAVLRIVKDKKDILFNSFQNNVSKREKEAAWLEVLRKAQSLGLTSADREWDYARDHLFGLWKCRTLAKRNNFKKTCSGRPVNLDKVDREILDILGKVTPDVNGVSSNQTKEKKLEVLRTVKENKEILFGSFQNNVSKRDKEKAWMEVLRKAQSLGLTSTKRDWNYARDHLFGQWKSRTLAKRANLEKTPTGGERTVAFDEVDKEIMDIIGNVPPLVESTSRSQTKEKKLEVLRLVKEKKEILFGSLRNNVESKKKKEEAWLEVLKKAQSLGLTSADREWDYARDHLFGLWKSRTLAKRYNSRKNGTVGKRAVVLDEVDEEILDIVGDVVPVMDDEEILDTVGDVVPVMQEVETLPKIEVDEETLEGNDFPAEEELRLPKDEFDEHVMDILEEVPPVANELGLHEGDGINFHPIDAISNSSQAFYNKEPETTRKTTDSLYRLKKEFLESGLYLNKLKILKLEKQLLMIPSKFTKELQNRSSIDKYSDVDFDSDIYSPETYSSLSDFEK